MTEHVCFHHVITAAHFSAYHVTRMCCKTLRLKGNHHTEMGNQHYLTMLQPALSFSPKELGRVDTRDLDMMNCSGERNLACWPKFLTACSKENTP